MRRRGGRHSARRASVRRGCQPSTTSMHEEPDDVGERDVPAAAQPRERRLRFRKLVRQRDAGRRAEPDHRAAEARPRTRGSPSRSRPASAPARSAGCCRTRRTRSPAPARSATTRRAAARTGIIDALSTSASRKIVPLNVSGSTSQSGRRAGSEIEDRDPDAEADERERSRSTR